MTNSTATKVGHQLDGKTALVTGGSSGIGLATAQRLGGAGATGIRADVSNVGDLTKVAEAIAARGQGLDVLFATPAAVSSPRWGRSPPTSLARYS